MLAFDALLLSLNSSLASLDAFNGSSEVLELETFGSASETAESVNSKDASRQFSSQHAEPHEDAVENTESSLGWLGVSPASAEVNATVAIACEVNAWGESSEMSRVAVAPASEAVVICVESSPASGMGHVA